MTDYEVAQELVFRLTGIPPTDWCGHRHVGMLLDMAEHISRQPKLIATTRRDIEEAANKTLFVAGMPHSEYRRSHDQR